MSLSPPPLDRRQALVAGALGAVGLSLPTLLAAEANTRPQRAKSVLLVVPWGGPAQMDTLDPKPDAPEEIRGAFRPIATRVAGTHISEHLPRLAGLADQYAIVRSVSHRITAHNPATYYTLTGRLPLTLKELAPALRSDWPSLGAVMARSQPAQRGLPGYVVAPCPLVDNGIANPGQHAGFLGTAHDPLIVSGDPSSADFAVPGLALAPGLTPARLADRADLLRRLESQRDQASATSSLDGYRDRAHDILSAAAGRHAFDLGREPDQVRARYGRGRLGQSVLLGRRLIEAGVRLVMVSDAQEKSNRRWDTHEGTYRDIQQNLVETDNALSALLTDLRDRGLLETTLVVWLAEFGRTPFVDDDGGRDHWPHCYSMLLAGGGIRGGVVHGASDRRGAYPQDQPCAPEDIHATLYHLLGIPRDTLLTDQLGRSAPLCTGRPLRGLCL